MQERKHILKATKEISMSKSAKEKISAVAKNIGGKELFIEKVEMAKKTLSSLKSLPI